MDLAALGLFVLGLALLVAGAELLVRGASLPEVATSVAAALACLPIFATGHLIARWEGGFFVAYYAAYVAYLILAAAEHDALPRFSAAALGFVLPLTAVTLIVLYARHRAARPAR